MKKIFLLVLLVVSTSLSFARKIYVSSTMGNDTRTITQAQSPSTPWASLSKIQSSMSSLGASDSILFMRGNSFSGTLRMFNKSRMYFGAYGTGANPLFWGTGATIPVMFRLTTCSNITFEGLTVSDTSISQSDRTVQAKIQIVFTMETNSQNNRVVNCVMDRIGYGMYINPKSNGQVMERCDIGNLRMIKNTPRTINADDDYGGVPVQISSRNNRIIGNYFHDCYAVSYDYGFDGGGIEFFEEGDTITGNQIMYNTFYDNNGTLEHGSTNDGIANNPIQSNTFAYNRVINCSSLFYLNNNGQYRAKLRNLMIFNNVIVQSAVSRTGSTRMISMATSDTTFNIATLRNNIFRISNGQSVARSTVFTGTQLVRSNNIYQLSNRSITNFTLTSTEISTQNPIWINTTDVNPLNWNFTPLSTGPAVKKGVWVNIARDFNNNIVNNPPDIGILQSNVIASSTFKYPEIHVLFYSPINRSLFINCDTSGVMMVVEQTGSRLQRFRYISNGDWISMSRLNTGIYYGVTYGRSIVFIR